MVIFAAIVAAVLLFWAVGAYNRLVRLRSAVLQAFGALDAGILHRIAFFGALDAAIAGPRRPSDVNLHEALRAAVIQLSASLAVSRAKPLDAGAVAALTAAFKPLAAAWQSVLNAGDEDTPNDAEGVPPALALDSWAQRYVQQEQVIEGATQQFNAAVALYNRAVAQFPANVLAWVFGFKSARPL